MKAGWHRSGIGAVAVAVTLAGGTLAGAAPAAASRVGSPAAPGPATAPPGTISTVAGGTGGPERGTSVALDPCGLTEAHGDLYVAGDQTIRELAGSGILSTRAGTGIFKPLNLTGPALAASLGGTCGVAVDGAGNLVIGKAGPALGLAASKFDRIEVVAAATGTYYGQPMREGHIYSVAGNGYPGVAHPGALATTTALGAPESVAIDHSGNIVIGDAGFSLHGRYHGSRIQVVAASSGTFYGQPMTAGHLYDIAGTSGKGESGDGGPATQAALSQGLGPVRVDSFGDILISDQGNKRIRIVAEHTGTCYGVPVRSSDIYTIAGDGRSGFARDGGPASHAELSQGAAAGLDLNGNLLIADLFNDRVRVVAARAGTFYGMPMTAGGIYTIAGDGSYQFSGDGGPALQAGMEPAAVTGDRAGNVVIADSIGFRVRVIAAHAGTYYGQPMTAGDIYSVAGDGGWDPNGAGGDPATIGYDGTTGGGFSGLAGPARRAEIDKPEGVATDPAGDLFLSDIATGRTELVPARTGTQFGRRMTAGDIENLAGNGTQGGPLGDGGPAASASLYAPQGLATDAVGNLLVADTCDNEVRVVAARSGTFYGRPMTAGHIYDLAGDAAVGQTGCWDPAGGYSGDGGPATSAQLANPQGVALDAAGNVLIADTVNGRIRVVADRSGTFYGQAMTAGNIYTIAGDGSYPFSGDGGPATSASLWYPASVALDHRGNVVIADSGNCRARVVATSTGIFYGQAMTAGDIYSIAGDGAGCAGGGGDCTGDGGPAISAGLSYPQAVAVDRHGNLAIADAGCTRAVRVVAAATGTFYGVPMTAGNIYTVAGSGADGFSGDGGPAVTAAVTAAAVAVTSAGDLLIADLYNNRIREVSG